MFNLHQLRLLRELANRGTIAAVAEALSYTPSAVSQQLSALERYAGVPLIERSGRRVVLTPAGQRLVGHVDVVLEHLETAQAELSASKGAAGTVRAGVYPSAARFLSAGIVTSLRDTSPDVELAIQEIDPADAPDALRAGQLDLALVHHYEGLLFPAEPGIESRSVFAERMFLAAPDDPASLGWQVDEADDPMRRWRRSPWILPTPGTLCHDAVTRLCERSGFRAESWHRVDDYDTTLRLVAAGVGVAVVPALSALEPPEGATLNPLPLDRRSAVAFRSGNGAHPSIAAFVSALRKALPPQVTAERRPGGPIG